MAQIIGQDNMIIEDDWMTYKALLSVALNKGTCQML